MLRLNQQLSGAVDVLQFFLINEWKWRTKNVIDLQAEMSEEDKKVREREREIRVLLHELVNFAPCKRGGLSHGFCLADLYEISLSVQNRIQRSCAVYCYNLSVVAALNARSTTNGMVGQNSTYKYAWAQGG